MYLSQQLCHCKIFSGDENYNMNYFNAFLEKSLSRLKRASRLSPVTGLLDMIGTDSTDLFQPILHFFEFITNLLTGQQNLCSTEKLSVEKLIEKLNKEIQYPFQAFEIILCFIYNIIGQETRSIAYTLFTTTSKFISTIFLPGLHTILNEIKDSPLMPADIKILIKAFNTFYEILKIIGYVK